jgi:hypothetical protein
MAENDKAQHRRYKDLEKWEQQMQNWDRTQERREARWRAFVIKIDGLLMAEVTQNSGRVHLDIINKLEPEAGF